MKQPDAYKGRRVVVLGMARSGAAAAKLFHSLGAVVTVNDAKERTACPEADELEALGISVVCGGHPDSLLDGDVALVVKNPGIPYEAPPVRRALELGIEVVTEVEPAYRVAKAPMVGITGSNGKTTTTTWVGLMLEAAGMKPIVAGNIGTPLCEAAQEAGEDNWLVVELSSFQLKGTDLFRPRIGALLNVYETHLDYHGTMKDYVESKLKLFANQTEDDIAVLNWDDGECRRRASSLRAKLLPFSRKEQLEHGVFLRRHAETGRLERDIVYRDEQGELHFILRATELGLPAEFNIENALAAAAIALAAGAPIEPVAAALKSFRGVEHRLEYVEEKNGVHYYNNSKATNPAATVKALEAFDRKVVLIAGGLDRGMEYTDMVPRLQEHVHAIVTLGETRDKLLAAAKQAGIEKAVAIDGAGKSAAETLDEAVRAAAGMAGSGDIVLLSPACASWDMFPSFEERGSMFKKSVHTL
ncbi:UDP-N-acetylmuramoylalanine--D-glutamate ligase [Paenibacillus sp. J31TS4]|uniref:UDP-N-acetylmuramoyl-L-alanine--D-glutamate ligase n=1 Tax=Paenibacillus sp. J31TS4 TaxID=2807195 RepID=UPI001AFEFC35|nr:UDP-N-acetylmuramoyl-L-alanine--D-glutamate ligase [Paenibacillus sp. J31TS4]GIP39677.1 UDP-N-acetylmuramoylalanine--D-glutamate ligase [Paenibacillus sp. J31TS4]